MDKARIEHVFFDLDNTLWDHRGNSEVTLEQMFKDYEITKKYKVTFEEWHEVFYEINEKLWVDLSEAKISKDDLRERRFKDPFAHFDIHEEGLGLEFEDEYLARMGKMKGTVEGAQEILEYLSDNYTIHIITNGFIEVSEAKLINADLLKYITTLTCADEIGVRKPDARIFDLANNKAGSNKDKAVIIGDDWVADVVGGTNFGWQAIYLDCFDEKPSLEGVPIITSLMEIKELL